jgi:hypothetical protein
MIAEAFEYHLQDLENQDNFEYCSLCGSCGCSGCCSPDSCKFMQCMYKEQNLEDYQFLLDENDKLRVLLQETVDFFGAEVNSDDDNYTDFLTLTEKLKKFVDITY